MQAKTGREELKKLRKEYLRIKDELEAERGAHSTLQVGAAVMQFAGSGYIPLVCGMGAYTCSSRGCTCTSPWVCLALSCPRPLSQPAHLPLGPPCMAVIGTW